MPAETEPPRVVVIGRGAVGTFLAGTLAWAGLRVSLVGRRPPGSEEAGSVRIEGPDGTIVALLDTPDGVAHCPTPDLVILAVKTFDLDGALASAARWSEAPLMTVQNGVGAEELARVARTSPILAGSLTTAVEPVTGGVRRLRTGGIGIAAVPGPGVETAAALAGLLAAAWTAAGLPARAYPDAAAMKWSKLLGNLVGNATSAILDLSPGEIYADRRSFPIERRQLHEAVAVMKAMGLQPVSLPGADVSLLLRGLALPEAIGRPIVARAIAGARGGKSPSLRLHVRGGGGAPTEAAWLNGAVAAAGARVGVPAPVNACLAALVDEVAADPERAAWFAGRPDRLGDSLAAWPAQP